MPLQKKKTSAKMYNSKNLLLFHQAGCLCVPGFSFAVENLIMHCAHFTKSALIRVIKRSSSVTRGSSAPTHKLPLVTATCLNCTVTVRDGERLKVSRPLLSFIKSCSSTDTEKKHDKWVGKCCPAPCHPQQDP